VFIFDIKFIVGAVVGVLFHNKLKAFGTWLLGKIRVWIGV
jgi:hypothetical protein